MKWHLSSRFRQSAALVAACCFAPAVPGAQPASPLGPNLENFAYPYPVRWFATKSQGQDVQMAYLDVSPGGRANGETVLLLHGKNFCAATWGDTIAALTARGYRVIAPDQIGFCKSSKPAGYQYSFNELASLTRDLLAQAGASPVAVVGHSTGGMLAVKLARLFPAQVSQVVLVNPLGLNDTLSEGVPYTGLGALRAEEAKTSASSIKAYQLNNYYHGRWRPEYDRWVGMLAGQYESPGGEVVRDAQARLSDMIQTQPTAHELKDVRPPVTLIIGQEDRTAFRANTAPVELRSSIRSVPIAAEAVVRAIPDVKILRLQGLGHAPQVEDPGRFIRALDNALIRTAS